MGLTALPATLAQLAERIRPVVEPDERVRFVYLFGSTARGDTQAGSDLDLAVYLRPTGTLIDEARLHQALSSALDRDDLDVVALNQAPLWLQFRIVGEGTVLFSRNEQERIAFRERVEKEFLDFRPYYEEYLAATRERARRGALTSG